jgi:hypothetical protein
MEPEWPSTWDWIYIGAGRPRYGGTYAVVFEGDVAWMYWNPDTQRWYPVRGWKRKVGYPVTAVEYWLPLPPPPEKP